MLVIISPAKTLDFDSPFIPVRATQPALLDASVRLVDVLRQQTPAALSTLMKISPALGTLNAQRYADWRVPFTTANARPALFAFKGEVYQGLQAETLSAADIRWAQQHLRVLSGLYGLLRPLDLIQPYRLEMGTRLRHGEFTNLYQFWGATITDALNDVLARQRNPLLLNLASSEYYGAVQADRINARIITPQFKELRNDRYQFLSFFGKRARGLMARQVVAGRITSPKALRAFSADGYRYSEALSGADDWVFVRDEPRVPAAARASAQAAH